jgi:NADH-quinone oxidoreductase subunit J
MITPQAILALGTALAAVGIWWLLPGSSILRWTLGGVLAVAGFVCFAWQVPALGDDWFTNGMFHAIAAATIVAAVATISFRSPVYCAIWFGMTLTGTAGLFLLAGAEFLAVATIVVYAGAILVTFLFVLMLSQPEGHTSYDRRSWEPMLAAFTGAVLVGILTTMIGTAIKTSAKNLPLSDAVQPAATEGQTAAQNTQVRRGFPDPAEASDRRSQHAPGDLRSEAWLGRRPATTETNTSLPEGEGDRPPTISQLGAELFTRYLVAVEAAGTLLFVALVGAAVIVSQGRAAMKWAAIPREGGAAHVS